MQRAAQPARSMLALLLSLGVTFGAAAVGAAASVRAADFYAQLVQPAWAPPASVFGPVWSALYLMMAIAAWWVWQCSTGAQRATALRWYAVQLVLNALWSWLFFGWRLGALALVEVVVLWLAIAVTVGAFWRIRKGAGMLLLPYLAWVGFAAALNAALWRLNPGPLGL